MFFSPESMLSSPPVLSTDALVPPAWVGKFSGLEVPTPDRSPLSAGVARNAEFCRVSVKISRAIDLPAGDLRAQVTNAYATIFAKLQEEAPTPDPRYSHGPGSLPIKFHPIRFWNFLPRIDEKIDGEQSRYMIFNAGRYDAFKYELGTDERFDRDIATASAVGHDSDDLCIHCLAQRSPGINLGNSRQVSPHRYSPRFGKLPPCFARATLLTESKFLLIGGTASIRGEDSLHDDLATQTDETLANITSVIGLSGHSCSSDPLRCVIDLRVYHPQSVDAGWLENHLRLAFPRLSQIEFLKADLCRPELLVEIEAVAQLAQEH